MEEQHHRRRRLHAEPDAQQPQTAEKTVRQEKAERDVPSHDVPLTGGEQTHYRRRRAAPPKQEHVDEPKEARKSAIDDDAVFWDPYAGQKSARPRQEQRKQAKLLHLFSSIDALVCRAGDFCLAAIQWIGVGLLFAAGYIAKGAKRLAKRVKPILRGTGKKATRGAVHTGKRIRQEKPQPDSQPEEPMLVATRPEDYRGMGEQRVHKGARGGHKPQKRVVRAPQKKTSPLELAVMAVLVCVVLVSAYMVLSILWRSISTRRLSDSLSQRYSELSGEQMEEAQEDGEEIGAIVFATPEPTAQPEQTEEVQQEPAEDAAAQTTAAPVKPDAVRSTKYHQVGGDALPEMEALYQDNRDLIGWLRMEGILDLPVVYKDNEYYLTHDFYKNKSASGTLFLDENHPFRENSQNLLLHGHNMKDGTMFGRLVQYETNLQFLKNNPFIQYSTLWEKEQYVIFAVLHVSLDVQSPEFFNYFTHPTFSSDAQFENYVRALQNRSVFSIPIDVDPSDALLTLSTCIQDDRLVIVARRVRDGESKSDLRHLVQLAARQ